MKECECGGKFFDSEDAEFCVECVTLWRFRSLRVKKMCEIPGCPKPRYGVLKCHRHYWEQIKQWGRGDATGNKIQEQNQAVSRQAD